MALTCYKCNQHSARRLDLHTQRRALDLDNAGDQLLHFARRGQAPDFLTHQRLVQIGENRLAMVGQLRSAYLAAFAALGYRYIFRPEFDVVRQQIAEPTVEHILVAGVTNLYMDPAVLKMMAVDVPRDLRCLVVQLGQRLLFLPGFGGGDQLYVKLVCDSSFVDRILDPKTYGKVVAWPTQPEMLLDFLDDVGKEAHLL